MWTSSVSDSGHFLCGFWVISTLSFSLLKLMVFLGTATGFSPCNPLSALKERFPAQAEPQQPSVSARRIKNYWQSNGQLKIRQVIELIIPFSVAAEMVSVEWSIDCSCVQLFCYQLQRISDIFAEIHFNIPTQLSAKWKWKLKRGVLAADLKNQIVPFHLAVAAMSQGGGGVDSGGAHC